MSNLYIEASVLFVEHFVDQEDINRQAGWQLEVIVTDCAPLFNTLKLGPVEILLKGYHSLAFTRCTNITESPPSSLSCTERCNRQSAHCRSFLWKIILLFCPHRSYFCSSKLRDLRLMEYVIKIKFSFSNTPNAERHRHSTTIPDLSSTHRS